MSEFAYKILDGLDVSNIQKTLVDNPQFFGAFQSRLVPNGAHRESTDIWVRYGDYIHYGNSVFLEQHDSVWYPIAKELPDIADIAFKLMAEVKGERLGGILITKIAPGKKIYPHIDVMGWHPNYYDKYYVPILNKEGAVFSFENLDIQGEEGSAYWFRNDVPHWVNNDSDSDRIAMVICIKPFKGFVNVQRHTY